MIKIIYIFLLIILSIEFTYACRVVNLWKEIPDTFYDSCYEKVWVLSPDIFWFDTWLWTSCIWRNTFILNSNEKIDTFISNNKIISHKIYKSLWESITYKINLDWDINYLKDDNFKTYLVFDTEQDDEIIIEFNNIIKSWSSEWFFSYDSKSYIANYYISIDWEKYSKVDIWWASNYLNLWDFDFKYLKIDFSPKNKDIVLREKIKLYEINIESNNYQYLIKTRWEFKAYSNNMCKDSYLNLSNNTGDFNIDSKTETLTLNLKSNPNFDLISQNDSDNDWVLDNEDNCKTIYNPMQKDKNWDLVWDLCSDDDKDWIIWEKDNCIYIYNPKQIDININLVWDLCEFDKDKDWVFDGLDNCINKINKYQEDKDKDGIWDACDNCDFYNPRQLDKNNNQIWDICEEREEYLIKNDLDKDWVIDDEDNCKKIYNPDQKDYDNDKIGDFCDNCKNIQNKDQIDFDKNWVWDICEDSDKDWIQWITDNCINIKNSDQVDSDNDWVWDACEDADNDYILANVDNCPYDYNPDQVDIDKDWNWDICDKKDDRYIESNSYFFIWLLVFITMIFWVWIYALIRKINK